MSRYINYDALNKDLGKRWNVSSDQDFADREVWRALREAPSIEIVRCKECKHWWETAGTNYGDCEHFALDTIADDFCSYGERRVSDGR